uniref:Uncharacterized protein n=1 Tax=Siphoviridae sp. ctgmM3 TaxID=2827912 RepID=A0A8S5TKZ1_9CAUD|nr:MAG TPA: hypothetical protein [Siphoviridae sp. ctgmM3]
MTIISKRVLILHKKRHSNRNDSIVFPLLN